MHTNPLDVSMLLQAAEHERAAAVVYAQLLLAIREPAAVTALDGALQLAVERVCILDSIFSAFGVDGDLELDACEMIRERWRSLSERLTAALTSADPLAIHEALELMTAVSVSRPELDWAELGAYAHALETDGGGPAAQLGGWFGETRMWSQPARLMN